jgi:hypothetical protein
MKMYYVRKASHNTLKVGFLIVFARRPHYLWCPKSRWGCKWDNTSHTHLLFELLENIPRIFKKSLQKIIKIKKMFFILFGKKNHFQKN